MLEFIVLSVVQYLVKIPKVVTIFKEIPRITSKECAYTIVRFNENFRNVLCPSLNRLLTVSLIVGYISY